MTTLLAEVMFSPTPPARVEIRKMKESGEVLNIERTRVPKVL